MPAPANLSVNNRRACLYAVLSTCNLCHNLSSMDYVLDNGFPVCAMMDAQGVVSFIRGQVRVGLESTRIEAIIGHV